MTDKRSIVSEIIVCGASLSIYVDRYGYLTLDLETSEIGQDFVHEGDNNIPKIRFILNEEDRRTDVEGEWEVTP